MAAPVMHKLPRPRLRARKLSIAGKSSYSGGKGAAFHPSGGNPAMSGAGMGGSIGGVPGAGSPGPGGDQPGAFAPMPPDQAFAGPNGG